jgi:ribosomal protein L21
MTDEDMEDITKEWSKEFLVLVEDVYLSDADIIGSPLVTQVELVGRVSAKKKKKKLEVQEIDEEENASTKDGYGSLEGGGEYEGNGQARWLEREM